ncbi:NfeD family protein [Rhodococcus sp. NPDC003318]|uniref:NfeD family protein n=1 Tax=Rhodococcus sp. NPDC003318 TaxID=3364503 RepID=UPI00367C58FE
MATIGVVAVVLGLVMILVEAHAPTAGVLSGVSALLIGAGIALLFLADGFAEAVALPIAIAVAGVGMVGAVALGRTTLTARRRPARGGPAGLVGHRATVRSWDGPTGQVRADGGLWMARIEFGYPETPPPAAGESVVVESVRGLTLGVRRREPWEELP